MHKIFQNSDYNIQFESKGYIKLPFPEVEKIDISKSKVLSLSPSDQFNAFQKNMIHAQDFHCTFFDSNEEYRLATFEIIKELFGSFASELLNNFEIVQANVFIKPPHQGYVAPHQNLTILDESKYTSLSFWCPALDTNTENGTMVVVPKSHKKFMKYRTTNISWPLLPLFKDYDSPFFETVNVKKGEILIIDDSLIHGTTNNKTADSRFVFHALLVPQNADLIYCEVDKIRDKVRRYSVPPLFWQLYTPGSTPTELPLIDELEYNENELSLEEFKKTLNG